MRFHPAIFMLIVWLGCIATYLILPFQLQNRSMTLYGFFVLALFVGSFTVSAFVASPIMSQRPRNLEVRPDFRRSDVILKVGAVIAMLSFILDLILQQNFDLVAAYIERSKRSTDLMTGADSSSSFAFQIGFLTYPAAYIYLIRQIGFEQRPKMMNVIGFGLFPILVATLSMGGRATLAYALVLAWLGFGIRKQLAGYEAGIGKRRSRGKANLGMKILLAVAAYLAMRYFIDVFAVRAESAGGLSGMFDIAQSSWGIKFDGALSGPMRSLLGEDNTYLIFVFSWYLVQGLVMSNVLFSQYDGPLHLGIYGIDLAAALMRRIDGSFVADRFAALISLNTYGFLPSAFGSLYVDLAFFGLAVCAFWGWLSGLVYRRVKQGDDPRWLLLAPFVSLGVFFSLINTPIGFSNGLMTYLWLVIAFLATRTGSFRPAWRISTISTLPA